MVSESGLVHRVSWRDCCPWLVLFRTFRLAVSVQLLLVASAGAVVNTVGWRLANTWFLPPGDIQADASLQADVQYLGRWPHQRGDPSLAANPETETPRRASDPSSVTPASPPAADRVRPWLESAPSDPVRTVVYRFVAPIRRLFDLDITWRQLAFYLFGSLWTLAVWSLAGGIIARIASVELGREERIGLGQAFGHGRKKWGPHMAAVWMPLMGVALMAVPMATLGWLLRFEWGIFVTGLLWLPLLLGGLVMMVLLLGLLFGWPLMWGTIATEGSDAFDAISRSYAYTFQRPLQYLWYGLVASGFGVLGWLLVWGASESIVHLTFWGTGWGAGRENIIAVQESVVSEGQLAGPARQAADAEPDEGRRPHVGMTWIQWSINVVRTLASGFAYSYFWCVAAAIYLLLRSDADNTEMDDVWLEDDSTTSYGLPPLTQDEAGVPGVDQQADHTPSPSGDSDSNR